MIDDLNDDKVRLLGMGNSDSNHEFRDVHPLFYAQNSESAAETEPSRKTATSSIAI